MRGPRELHEDEQGTTLLEMVVGMALLAVFMGMFTGAMLMMSNTVNKVEAVTTSSGQVNAAFLQLDKTVRYATGISPIGTGNVTGETHVEFAMIDQNDTTKCVQLRLFGGKLQRRTWVPSSDGVTYSGLSGWSTLASNVSTDRTSSFAVPPAANGASSSYQQLTITINAGSGTNTAGSTTSSMTFTALNSVAGSTNPVCQQVSVDATP